MNGEASGRLFSCGGVLKELRQRRKDICSDGHEIRAQRWKAARFRQRSLVEVEPAIDFDLYRVNAPARAAVVFGDEPACLRPVQLHVVASGRKAVAQQAR